MSCPVCGLALTWPGANGLCPNRWCRRADRSFSVVFSLGAHQGALRHALLRYKYSGELWWGRVFAQLAARYLQTNAAWFEEFGVLGCVPAFTGPGARRRWDPVRLIVEQIGALAGAAWQVETDLLVKTAETPAMQGLDWAGRQAVARGPLRASLKVRRPSVLEGQRVLVFDDVMTEGSTLREVARALRFAGASEVAGLVLVRHTWSERGAETGRGEGS